MSQSRDHSHKGPVHLAVPHDLTRRQTALDEGQTRRDQDSEQQSHDTQRPAVAVPLEEELNENWNGAAHIRGDVS